MPKTVLRTFDKPEPAHLEDLWHPGSPRPSRRWETDGLCFHCGDPLPNTRITWTPVGLMCIRCQLEFARRDDGWRQRAKERARRVFEMFGIPVAEAGEESGYT